MLWVLGAGGALVQFEPVCGEVPTSIACAVSFARAAAQDGPLESVKAKGTLQDTSHSIVLVSGLTRSRARQAQNHVVQRKGRWPPRQHFAPICLQWHTREAFSYPCWPASALGWTGKPSARQQPRLG